jgi:hypothetical protein
MLRKTAYIGPKVVEPFLRPGTSRGYVHRAAPLLYVIHVLEGEPWHSGKVVALVTMRSCAHKIQSGQILPRTLRKQELQAPGCSFFVAPWVSNELNETQYHQFLGVILLVI